MEDKTIAQKEGPVSELGGLAQLLALARPQTSVTQGSIAPNQLSILNQLLGNTTTLDSRVLGLLQSQLPAMVRQTMEAKVPSISAGAQGAGIKNSTTKALLQQQLLERMQEAANLQYGNLYQQLGQTESNQIGNVAQAAKMSTGAEQKVAAPQVDFGTLALTLAGSQILKDIGSGDAAAGKGLIGGIGDLITKGQDWWNAGQVSVPAGYEYNGDQAAKDAMAYFGGDQSSNFPSGVSSNSDSTTANPLGNLSAVYEGVTPESAQGVTDSTESLAPGEMQVNAGTGVDASSLAAIRSLIRSSQDSEVTGGEAAQAAYQYAINSNPYTAAANLVMNLAAPEMARDTATSVTEFGDATLGSAIDAVNNTLGSAEDVVKSAGELLTGGGGGCFITTAVCQYLGLPDNCDQLTVLREFRDKWATINHPEDVAKYYAEAPAICEKLNSHPSKEDLYLALRLCYIDPCVAACKSGDYELAYLIYSLMWESLQGV